MPPEPTDIVADAALRLAAPQARPRGLARPIFATLIALGLELGGFWLVWAEREQAPAPPAEEIPVEIVVEPPPPPPPPPKPEPTAEPQSQPDEKPAIDAPREGKGDHDDEHVAEKEKPAAAPPPPAPSPPPSPEPPKPAPEPLPPPSPEASTAAPAPAPELPKADEAEAPPPVKAEPKPDSKPDSKPAPNPAVLAALPKTYDSVPDADFGGEAIKSPVTGGAAKSTYLSLLYGLIVPRLRVPAVARAYGRRLTGVIGIQVDGHGRLTQRFVLEGSGSLELDEAAMQAVAAAAHLFPPPPHGAGMGMKFTYTVE